MIRLTKMKTYSYYHPLSKSVVIVEYYCQQDAQKQQPSEPFRFRRIDIDASSKMAAEETPNYCYL
jgi:hypothetical protein